MIEDKLEQLIDCFRPVVGNLDHIFILEKLKELENLKKFKTREISAKYLETMIVNLIKAEISKGYKKEKYGHTTTDY